MAAPVTIDFGANAGPLVREIERIKTEIKGLDASSSSFNANYKRLMGEASLANRQFNASLREASQASQGFSLNMGAVSTAMASIAAIGGAAALAFNSVLGLADRADDISDVADALGITGSELQSLSSTAALSGLEFEKFGRVMGKVSTFTIDGNKALESMGVSLKGLSTSDAVYKIAEVFANMQDGAGKSALAIELFGKAGLAMVPFLNQGADALRAQTKEFEKYGLVLTGPTLEATGKLADGWQVLIEQSKNIITNAISPLIGSMGDLIGMINSVRAAGAGMWDGIVSYFRGVDKSVASAKENLASLNKALGEQRTPGGREQVQKHIQAETERLKALEKVQTAQSAVNAETKKADDAGKKITYTYRGLSDAATKAAGGGGGKGGGVRAVADAMTQYADSVKRAQADIDSIGQKQVILSGLLENGAISAQTFRIEMKKLTDASTNFNNALAGTNQLDVFRKQAIDTSKDFDLLPEKLKELKRLLDAGEISKTVFDRMQESLGVVLSPMEEVNKQLRETQDELDRTTQKKAALDEVMSSNAGGFSTEAFDKVGESLKGANKELDFMGVAVGDLVSQGVQGLVDVFFSANQSFSQFAKSFLTQIAKMIAQALILKAVNAAIGAFTGGGTAKASANGNAFSGMSVPHGIYNQPTYFNYGHQIKPFALGGTFSRMGVLGEAGPEVVAPLRRNRQGQLGVGAAPVQVNVYNENKDNKVEVRESTKPDGQRTIDVMIRKHVAQMFGDGSMDRSFQKRYGLSPRPA